MRNTFLCRAALFASLAAGAIPATAQPFDRRNVTIAAVGPVTAPIAALNYDESGAAVNGFLIGTNTLLVFPRSVCGGIGTLGAVGNNVTYSGMAETFSSGFQTVRVTSFTNGSIVYPPPAPPKPSAYALTAGTITKLNYDPDGGSIDGFLFTPASGTAVFVDMGDASATLAPLLTVGAAVSVTGTLEAPPACTPVGTVSEVDPSSLTIGTTVYKIGFRR